MVRVPRSSSPAPCMRGMWGMCVCPCRCSPNQYPLSHSCSVLPACSCLPGMRACLFCFCEKVGPPPHPVPAAGIGCLGPLSCNCRGPPTQIWWGPDGKHAPFRFYFPQGFPRGPKASRTGQLHLPSLQYTAGNGCGGGPPIPEFVASTAPFLCAEVHLHHSLSTVDAGAVQLSSTPPRDSTAGALIHAQVDAGAVQLSSTAGQCHRRSRHGC